MCKKCAQLCAQKCANFCVNFFFFLCKICAHFLHISNLHSVFRPREDTVTGKLRLIQKPTVTVTAVVWRAPPP